MLINSYQERLRLAEYKQARLLTFLRDETWSSAANVALLLECTLSGAYKTLYQLERKGLITSHQMASISLKIWGITPLGLFESWDNDAVQLRRNFQPSKINPLFVQHHLDLQVAMLKAQKTGIQKWMNGKLLPKSMPQRPDAIMTMNSGSVMAIEYERTVKSKKRYEVIFSKYLQAIKAGEYQFIYYICPDDIFAERLSRLFTLIKSVPVAGQRVTLTDKHRSKFIVSSLQDWPMQ